MLKTLPCLLLGAALAAASASQAATVTVSFVDPDHFTDAGYSQSRPSERDLAELQAEFERYLQRLANQNLPLTAVLKLEMLDIDLAGQIEPGRRGLASDVRVVREVTIPRLKFRYTLQDGDRVVSRGEEYLSDLDFMRSYGRLTSDDRYRYEKTLLGNWFEHRLRKH